MTEGTDTRDAAIRALNEALIGGFGIEPSTDSYHGYPVTKVQAGRYLTLAWMVSEDAPAVAVVQYPDYRAAFEMGQRGTFIHCIVWDDLDDLGGMAATINLIQTHGMAYQDDEDEFRRRVRELG